MITSIIFLKDEKSEEMSLSEKDLYLLIGIAAAITITASLIMVVVCFNRSCCCCLRNENELQIYDENGWWKRTQKDLLLKEIFVFIYLKEIIIVILYEIWNEHLYFGLKNKTNNKISKILKILLEIDIDLRLK